MMTLTVIIIYLKLSYFFLEVGAALLLPRHYTIGKEIVDLVLDRIRKLADNCTGSNSCA